MSSPSASSTAVARETALVYDAEERIQRWIDLGQITVFGSLWDVPNDLKFADVASIQSYADRVLALSGHPTPVRVRERRGHTRAHYSPDGSEIAIPTHRYAGGWAMREFVVLHELAHHHAAPVADHGPTFRTTMLRLLTIAGHETTARLLEMSFWDAGLPTPSLQPSHAATPPERPHAP